jgi:hypothetical protein
VPGHPAPGAAAPGLAGPGLETPGCDTPGTDPDATDATTRANATKNTDESDPEHTVAPNVDARWAADFIVALRLHGVDGARIGEALAEVNDHVKSSGESAEDAFGTPEEYAKKLAMPASPDQSTGAMLGVVAPIVIQVVAMSLILAALPPLRDGYTTDMTSGSILSLALTVCAMVALAAFSGPILSFSIRKTAIAVAAWLLAITACILPTVLIRGPILMLPTVPLLVAALVLMVAAGVWIALHPVADDRITTPARAPETHKDTAHDAAHTARPTPRQAAAGLPATESEPEPELEPAPEREPEPGAGPESDPDAKPSPSLARALAPALFVPIATIALGVFTWFMR